MFWYSACLVLACWQAVVHAVWPAGSCVITDAAPRQVLA
jgi:hypothetical protein